MPKKSTKIKGLIKAGTLASRIKTVNKAKMLAHPGHRGFMSIADTEEGLGRLYEAQVRFSDLLCTMMEKAKGIEPTLAEIQVLAEINDTLFTNLVVIRNGLVDRRIEEARDITAPTTVSDVEAEARQKRIKEHFDGMRAKFAGIS